MFSRDISVEGEEVRARDRRRMGANKRYPAHKAPISSFSRCMISEPFRVSTTGSTTDSIGRTDITFFIKILLTGIWKIVKG